MKHSDQLFVCISSGCVLLDWICWQAYMVRYNCLEKNISTTFATCLKITLNRDDRKNKIKTTFLVFFYLLYTHMPTTYNQMLWKSEIQFSSHFIKWCMTQFVIITAFFFSFIFFMLSLCSYCFQNYIATTMGLPARFTIETKLNRQLNERE